MEKREYSCTVGGNINWHSHYGRQNGDSLKNYELKPLYDPATPLLGIYSEETKTERDTCIPLFTVPLFSIARTWRPPRCPLTIKWIKNLWYISRMKYYSAIKRNSFESVLIRWMNLEPIIQNQVSQKEIDSLMHIYGI